MKWDMVGAIPTPALTVTLQMGIHHLVFALADTFWVTGNKGEAPFETETPPISGMGGSSCANYYVYQVT